MLYKIVDVVENSTLCVLGVVAVLPRHAIIVQGPLQ